MAGGDDYFRIKSTPSSGLGISRTDGTSTTEKVDAGKTGPALDPTKAVPQGAIASGLAREAPIAKTAPKSTSPDDIGEQQRLADPKVKEVFTKPARQTSTTVTFRMEGYGGKEIKPGEKWLFQIPKELRGTPIRTAILAHRKDSKYASSVKKESGREWDSEGAYNLVTARVTGGDRWVTWRDQYGSKKFAEPRSSGDPENENLHDWLSCVGATHVDLISVENVGSGANAVANVHFLEIEFFPPGKVSERIEEIFTPGTSFADPAKGVMTPKYGGGMGGRLSHTTLKEKGLYPDAVEIGGGYSSYGAGGGKGKVSEHAYVDSSGRLHIKLPPGKRLGGFEISCGDTAFDKNRPIDEQRNKDGHVGRLGWAKLYARIQNTKSSGAGERPFMDRINVPPSGVLSGGPNEPCYVTKEGDEIVVSSEGHASWVMGYRVTFVETEPESSQGAASAQSPEASKSELTGPSGKGLKGFFGQVIKGLGDALGRAEVERKDPEALSKAQASLALHGEQTAAVVANASELRAQALKSGVITDETLSTLQDSAAALEATKTLADALSKGPDAK